MGWTRLGSGTTPKVKALQADLLAVMATLEAIARQDNWPESCFKELEDRKGSPCEGLIELILKDNGTQYRIFGFFGPDDDDFTMLCRSGKATIRNTGVHAKRLREGKRR